MSKNPVLYKVLVVGVIVLFIGLGVQPAIATVEPEQPVNEGCNLCAKKVGKQQLVLIKSLLNRVEKYDTQLSVLSEQYPQFEEVNQKVSVIISKLQGLNVDINFCDFLMDLGCFFGDLSDSIIFWILRPVKAMISLVIAMLLCELWFKLCDPWYLSTSSSSII